MYKYQPLFSHTIFLRKLLEWTGDLKLSNSFIKNLRIIYEFEYKYHKILETQMINQKRKDNILNEIERRIKPILNSVVDELLNVYNIWIQNHEIFDDITNVDKWVRLKYNLIQYDNMNDLIEGAIVDYEVFSKKDNTFNKDALDLFKSTSNDVASIQVFAEKYIYPSWLNYYKNKGVTKIKRNIETVRNNLKRAKNTNNFSKIIAEISIALTISHLSNSMKEYISLYTDATVEELEALSNIDMNMIKKWDKDLVEMGVY